MTGKVNKCSLLLVTFPGLPPPYICHLLSPVFSQGFVAKYLGSAKWGVEEALFLYSQPWWELHGME